MTTPRRWAGRAALGLAVATGAYACGVEPRWVEVTRPRRGWPGPQASSPRALRVMHLSDLHGDSPGNVEEQVVRLVESERPDLIALTGDTCDHGTFASYVPFLSRLHAPLGVFAVQGNWEHWSPAADEIDAYRSANITLLVNEARRVRDDLWIVGFDDSTGGTPDAAKALRDVPAGAWTIGLMHSPAFFDVVAGRVTVALAGHTHGGQVCAPIVGPLWLPQGCGRYVAGPYEERGSWLYVSRGLGTSMLPIRFLARPEVAIVTIGGGPP